MRRVNGILTALLTVLFLGHAALRAAALHLPLAASALWPVWLAAAVAAAHVVASAVTSWQMLADEQRPPSSQKKRHLALKWATGAALLALAVAHVAGPVHAVAARALAFALTIALAAHVCVGAKSLLKDLGLPREQRAAFRAAIVALAAAVCLALALP